MLAALKRNNLRRSSSKTPIAPQIHGPWTGLVQCNPKTSIDKLAALSSVELTSTVRGCKWYASLCGCLQGSQSYAPHSTDLSDPLDQEIAGKDSKKKIFSPAN